MKPLGLHWETGSVRHSTADGRGAPLGRLGHRVSQLHYFREGSPALPTEGREPVRPAAPELGDNALDKLPKGEILFANGLQLLGVGPTEIRSQGRRGHLGARGWASSSLWWDVVVPACQPRWVNICAQTGAWSSYHLAARLWDSLTLTFDSCCPLPKTMPRCE